MGTLARPTAVDCWRNSGKSAQATCRHRPALQILVGNLKHFKLDLPLGNGNLDFVAFFGAKQTTADRAGNQVPAGVIVFVAFP